MLFGLKYYAELRSKFKGILWRVEIAERGYGGPSEEMAFDGGTPLQITWEKRGDEFYVPVKASEATINILCKENFHYLSLFTSDPRQFRVSILRNKKLYWRGFVTADLYSENFTAPPYQVSIKAVDGFNLLSSIPFRDLLGIGITGKCSLWRLLAACIDLLELDVDTADWMDLYGEGMDTEQSPLRQTYIDLERLYYVYEEPTYRDILELCLRPFAGQIFQSNGALHIRRAVSLYQTLRPMSFYSVGTEYPIGHIVTSDGLRLVIHTGPQIVTSASRERIDGMWNGNLHVMGQSTLDIVPALRTVAVSVKNKALNNLIDHLGFYNLTAWTDPRSFISKKNETDLSFCGNDDYQGVEITTQGVPVKQCNYPLTLEFGLQTYHNEWGFGWSQNPDATFNVTVHYGIRIVGEKATWSLASTGVWVQGNNEITSEVKTGNEENVKIEMQGIPIDGQWQFFFRQTMIGKVIDPGSGSRTQGHRESAAFRKMTLTIDADENYDKGLQYESLINPANNVDMSVQLPVSDIPAIPNDHLLYALYFLDQSGNPTRIWHTKGRSDYNTLIGHIVQGALRYKQLPSRRITGEIFTGLHLDMNTVVRDDKYLKAGYYINSIELNALTDTYNSELVEMPKLIATDIPPEGDDCVVAAELPATVETIVRCLNLLLIRSGRKVYAFDAATGRIREIYTNTRTFGIHPADEGFVVVDGKTIYYLDYRGTVRQLYTPENGYNDLSTYLDGYFYILKEYRQYIRPRGGNDGGRSIRSNDLNYRLYHYLNRPEYIFEDDGSYQRGPNINATTMSGDIRGMLRTTNTIVVNTSQYTCLHDKRFQKPCYMQILEAGTEIVSVSDNFLGINLNDEFLIYRRDSITERTLLFHAGRCADYADHTMSEFAHCYDNEITVRNFHDNTTHRVLDKAGLGQTIRGLFFINGELHIVRDKTIYKYIP